MSFWVTAYCHKSVVHVTAKDLLVGIGERLDSLAEQFPGDHPEEETPEAIEAVLARLRIVGRPGRAKFRHQALVYSDDRPPITLVHQGERENVPGVIADEVLPGRLSRMRRPEAQRVRELLAGAIECVSFSLKESHYTGVGFPLALAAADVFVTAGGGIIRSGSSSWMVPAGEGMDIILEYEE